MKNPGLSVLLGLCGGAGFAWLLNHLPYAIAVWLAAASTILLVGWMLMLHRGLRRSEKRYEESQAAFERSVRAFRETHE